MCELSKTQYSWLSLLLVNFIIIAVSTFNCFSFMFAKLVQIVFKLPYFQNSLYYFHIIRGNY